MTTRLIPFVICLLATVSLAGQFTWTPKLEITAGVTSYTPYDDFSRMVLTTNGRPFTQGNGNIAEPTLMPFLRLGLANTVSDRWEMSAYLEYHTGEGTLFDQDLYIFGVSDLTPEEKRHSFPAANTMRMFVAGVDARYALFYNERTRLNVGTGLAFMTHSHTYRELLTVDFTEARDVISVGEEFITRNRTALSIPLLLELSHQLTDEVTVGLHSRLQFPPSYEDMFWSAGLRVGFRL